MFKKFCLVSLLLTSSVYGNEPILEYSEAYKLFHKERKPLVVVIGADWCHGCVLMKKDTIIPMHNSGEFKDCILTTVDVDKDSKLVEQLLAVDGKTKQTIRVYPQIVVFAYKQDECKKFNLVGRHFRSKVVEFIKKSLHK